MLSELVAAAVCGVDKDKTQIEKRQTQREKKRERVGRDRGCKLRDLHKLDDESYR